MKAHEQQTAHKAIRLGRLRNGAVSGPPFYGGRGQGQPVLARFFFFFYYLPQYVYYESIPQDSPGGGKY